MPTISHLHERGNERLVEEISWKTADFLTRFHNMMKSKGFVRKVSKQSAMFDWRYENGDRVICLDGWHGTGTKGTNRHYGDLKLAFTLYDNFRDGKQHSKFDTRKVLGLDISKDPHEKVDGFYKQLEDYIRKI